MVFISSGSLAVGVGTAPLLVGVCEACQLVDTFAGDDPYQ